MCSSNISIIVDARDMSEHGAALQTYNQELVKCLEDLKIKKSELVDIIDKEESEKLILEKSLRSLQEKLNNLNNNLLQHKNLCDSYDRAIRDTENGFKKILESSQTLLNLAQHEAHKLETYVHKNCNYDNSIQNGYTSVQNVLDY